jgi:hypothetical protein
MSQEEIKTESVKPEAKPVAKKEEKKKVVNHREVLELAIEAALKAYGKEESVAAAKRDAAIARAGMAFMRSGKKK